MIDVLFILLALASAGLGLYLRRKRLSRPCVLDPLDKIEWFAQQRRNSAPR